MSESDYITRLSAALGDVGIGGGRRARILAEFEDHLATDPGADLGEPRQIAAQFADELGTDLARRAAYRSFSVLAASGLALLAMFGTGGRFRGWVGYGSYRWTYVPAWYLTVIIVCVLAAQVSLASGALAVMRALRRRRARVIPAAEVTILNRRALVAVVSGAIAMLILPLTDVQFPSGDGATWWMAALVIGVVSIVALLVTLPALLASTRLKLSHPGDPGDLLTDLGTQTAEAGLTPTRVAFLLSAVILIALTAVGVRADDPYDGVLRGVADALACLTGFALLGRYLGLRTGSRE